ncbi:transferase family-domain-containing protein [Xylogone sp. PMI_703]|nr:transferase family-domain-containing protein [Xylogone sp. PMI_703]
MHIPNTVQDLNGAVDIFGQQPSLQIYTQICLCYPMTDESSQEAIISTLAIGLERLSASFPWVSCQVVNEGASAGNTGIFRLKLLRKTPSLVVKDLRNDPSAPSMEKLKQAKFPICMLDEGILAPRNTIPGTSGEPTYDTKPVFLIQVTFITGGLLLTIVGLHCVMDMNGQGQIMRLLQKACHNEAFTDEELKIGNLAHDSIVPLLDDSFDPTAELDHQIVKPTSARPNPTTPDGTPFPPPPPPPKCYWANFTFSSTSLQALKLLTMRSIMIPPGSYISTDDAITAIIWQSIIRARQSRLTPTTEVHFGRAIDCRRYLGIPASYTGVLVNMTYHKRVVGKLLKEPLGSVALEFRAAVDPRTSTLRHMTQAAATYLSRTADKSIYSVGASLNMSQDITLSSWSRINAYELDFNLGLGKPKSVRRPQFVPCENLIYLLPKSTEGDVTAAICISEDDMDKLRADEEFKKYATFVG